MSAALGDTGIIMPPPLILASASQSRRQILAHAGLDFTIEPSGVDEDEVGGGRAHGAPRAAARRTRAGTAETRAAGPDEQAEAALVAIKPGLGFAGAFRRRSIFHGGENLVDGAHGNSPHGMA